jgi:hypothetical protein
MKRVLIWSLLAALGSVSVAAQAAAPAKASGPASGVCGELPCANTPGGEDPTEAALKKAAAESKKINDSGSDRQRWEDITLYSEATNPAELSMPLIKAAGLQLRLDPKEGQLVVEKNGGQQVYGIASAANDSKSLCPRYKLRVMDGSSEHAVLEKVCVGYDYVWSNKPKYASGLDIYLLDMKTATMVTLWSGSQTEKGAPLPRPKPVPVLRKIANGYQLDWNAVNSADKSKISVHNKYVRGTDAKSGKPELVCSDLRAPKGEEHGGTCGGGAVPMLKNTLSL